jgi:hypothetical protein
MVTGYAQQLIFPIILAEATGDAQQPYFLNIFTNDA